MKYENDLKDFIIILTEQQDSILKHLKRYYPKVVYTLNPLLLLEAPEEKLRRYRRQLRLGIFRMEIALLKAKKDRLREHLKGKVSVTALLLEPQLKLLKIATYYYQSLLRIIRLQLEEKVNRGTLNETREYRVQQTLADLAYLRNNIDYISDNLFYTIIT